MAEHLIPLIESIKRKHREFPAHSSWKLWYEQDVSQSYQPIQVFLRHRDFKEHPVFSTKYISDRRVYNTLVLPSIRKYKTSAEDVMFQETASTPLGMFGVQVAQDTEVSREVAVDEIKEFAMQTGSVFFHPDMNITIELGKFCQSRSYTEVLDKIHDENSGVGYKLRVTVLATTSEVLRKPPKEIVKTLATSIGWFDF